MRPGCAWVLVIGGGLVSVAIVTAFVFTKGGDWRVAAFLCSPFLLLAGAGLLSLRNWRLGRVAYEAGDAIALDAIPRPSAAGDHTQGEGEVERHFREFSTTHTLIAESCTLPSSRWWGTRPPTVPFHVLWQVRSTITAMRRREGRLECVAFEIHNPQQARFVAFSDAGILVHLFYQLASVQDWTRPDQVRARLHDAAVALGFGGLEASLQLHREHGDNPHLAALITCTY